MWSWLSFGLIAITCLLCLICVAKLERKKKSAGKWTLLMCCFIVVTLAVLFNNSFTDTETREYSYQFKNPDIVLKELKPQEVIEQEPETVPERPDESGVLKRVNPKKAMVIVNNLHIRDAADINAPLQGTVIYGQIVTILEHPVDSDWVKVDTGSGITGWVTKEYLNPLLEEPGGQEPEIKLGG